MYVLFYLRNKKYKLAKSLLNRFSAYKIRVRYEYTLFLNYIDKITPNIFFAKQA